MADTRKIALAQINPTLGDIATNLEKIVDIAENAAAKGADIVIFPEMCLTGYPTHDLVTRPSFLVSCDHALDQLCAKLSELDCAIIVGYPTFRNGKIYNVAGVIEGGKVVSEVYKSHLPNMSVFDEPRVFDTGPLPGPVSVKGIRIGLGICEDVWHDDFIECVSETGAELIVAINGSPYWADKQEERIQNGVLRVTQTKLPYLYVNFVGGQDELVFDGGSFLLNSDLSLPAQMAFFEEQLLITDWVNEGQGWRCTSSETSEQPDKETLDWQAMVLGLRDYVQKNGFEHVLLGLSGGIDSALTATIAVDALGAENVHGIMLPYHYTSQASLDDAKSIAKALGIRYDIVPIHEGVEGVHASLSDLFSGLKPGLAEENIQARMRGLTLMAISNKLGGLLLTTGNKSEVAVGYATLYGDMCGGFNPIKDLYKTEVFALSQWRNSHRPACSLGPAPGPDIIIFPESILTKAPSAELRENQTDQDSLPDYDILDQILFQLIEKSSSLQDIIALGFEPDITRHVAHLLQQNEFKRQQGAIGVKLTRMAFGLDWRYPITNNFKESVS